MLSNVRNKLAENKAGVDELLSVGEAPVDAKLDRTELAAYAGVMNVILNLDEVLTRE